MGHSTASGRPQATAAWEPHELDLPRGVTEAQKRVLDSIKRQIDAARTNSFEDWHQKYYGRSVEDVRDRYRNDASGAERAIQHSRDYYEDLRSGEGLVGASGPTIRKLERLGLIRILRDSTGTGSFSSDRIRLLNY